MNTIKPQSLIVGFLIVGIFWFMEVSNRPDSIPDYRVKQDHLSNTELSTASSFNTKQPETSSTVFDDQKQQEKTIPLTAKLLVANRGEFFAATQHHNALPAQERAQLGMIPKPLEKEPPPAVTRQHPEKTEEVCLSHQCIGPGISDY